MQQRVFSCLLIFLQSWMLWHFSRQPVLPLIACVLAVFSIPETFRFRLPRHFWNAAVLATSAAVVGVNLMLPSIPNGEWILPASYATSLAAVFLFLQVLENYRRRPDGALPAHYSLLSLLTVIFCFCRTYMIDESQTMFWSAIGVAMLVGLLLQASRNQAARQVDLFTDEPKDLSDSPSSSSGRNSGTSDTPGIRFMSLGRLMLLLGSFAGVTFGTWYLTGVLSRNVEYARILLFPGSEVYQLDLGTSQAYSDSARLGTINESQLSNPTGLALDVYADFEPGYLRGRCYDTLRGNEWVMIEETAQAGLLNRKPHRELQVVRPRPAGISYNGYGQDVFGVTGEQTGPWQEITVQNDAFRGTVFFTPLGADYLQVFRTIGLKMDDNQVLRNGLEKRRPYSAYLNRRQTPDPIPPQTRPELLSIPQRMDPKALAVADRIFAGDDTDLQRFLSIENWFGNNYRYSLKGFQIPSNVDQLSYFILEKPAMHCEFFASATAVLLRTQGIPTRYVTGYTVSQKGSKSDNHWEALNSNAHAWVEAYDRDHNKWLIVESTPGINAIRDVWQNVTKEEELAQIREAELALSEAEASTQSWFNFDWIRELFESLGNYVQIGLSLILLALLAAYLLKRRYQDYLRGRRGKYDPRFARHADALRQYEKKLRTLGIVRSDNETIHQFAGRVRKLEGEPWHEEAADAFLNYASIRYAAG